MLLAWALYLTYLRTKVLLKYDIVRKGGSLTLTSGTAGIKPGKGAAVGGALNGGVLSLTKGLAADLADKKIRVNTVVPGLVKTPLWDKRKFPSHRNYCCCSVDNGTG